MMKLRSLPSASSRVFRVLLYSTRTLTRKPSPPPDSTKPTLFHRLAAFRNPSITPILDQWVEEGRFIDQQDLQRIIKQFRKFGRHKHALQICQWMNDKPFLDITHKDVSVHLELISKVHGLKQAEEYFNKIPDTSRVCKVYGALLKCYADAKSLQMAEATMQKMRDLGYSGSLTYNSMLGLYFALGKHEKLDFLMEEMEQKGIPFDKFTYVIRLNAYANTSEIRQMEKLLLKMEADPQVVMDWRPYTVAANGYLKVGDTEKAVASLRKSEQLIRESKRKPAYEILLTLYASLGRKDEVYRIWNHYKNLGKFYNNGYLCMLSSLAKLDALDDTEKIYEEWEKGHTNFDFQIPNFLITAYCKRGLLDKAESMVNKLVESGKEPNWSTWSRMALGYAKNDAMDKAVEAMRKSILASSPGWRVDTATLLACLDYLDSKGDLDGAEEIMKLLKERGHLSEVVYKRIVKDLSRETPI